MSSPYPGQSGPQGPGSYGGPPPWQQGGPGSPPPSSGGGGGKTGLVVAAVLGVVLLLVGAVVATVLLTGGDDDEADVAASSPSASSAEPSASASEVPEPSDDPPSPSEAPSTAAAEPSGPDGPEVGPFGFRPFPDALFGHVLDPELTQTFSDLVAPDGDARGYTNGQTEFVVVYGSGELGPDEEAADVVEVLLVELVPREIDPDELLFPASSVGDAVACVDTTADPDTPFFFICAVADEGGRFLAFLDARPTDAPTAVRGVEQVWAEVA